MLKRYKVTCLTLLSCLAFSAPLHAESTAEDGRLVTFSGFGTIGLVHNQAKGASLARDISEANGATNKGLFWETDSRLGLQATIKPTEYLEGVAQIISRYRAENNFQPELTWGFIKYSPNDSIDIRAGRLGFDVFLAADSRDVGYSYLWVRPPIEYYGAIPLSYIDGSDITFRLPVANGVTRLKLYSGLDRQPVATMLNQTSWAGNMTAQNGSAEDLSGSRIIGGMLDYQDNNWTLRLGQADIRISHEFPVGLFDVFGMIHNQAESIAPSNPGLANSLNALVKDISLAGKHITFTNFGMSYDNGPLRAQLALSHFDSETLLFAGANSGYLSLGYRHGSFTPYAAISAVRSKKSTRADELAGQGVDTIVSVANFMQSTSQQTQRTYSVGMRYDFNARAALKFQVDMIHNNTCSPVSLPIVGPAPPCAPSMLWKSVPVSWDGRATVFSTVLDFTF